MWRHAHVGKGGVGRGQEERGGGGSKSGGKTAGGRMNKYAVGGGGGGGGGGGEMRHENKGGDVQTFRESVGRCLRSSGLELRREPDAGVD